MTSVGVKMSLTLEEAVATATDGTGCCSIIACAGAAEAVLSAGFDTSSKPLVGT